MADAIRQRRGERGLTPLDGMLLNAPPIAEGWNKLLGGVRTGSSLQDDLREIMVSRRGRDRGVVLGVGCSILYHQLTPTIRCLDLFIVAL